MANTTPRRFDAARVERLREAIASGTYRIDAEFIAERLIVDARAALRQRRYFASPASGGRLRRVQ